MRLASLMRAILAGLCALACASCGPHMNIQPSIKPYERQMPNLPAGTVPVTGRLRTLTHQQSRLAKNPLPKTAINLHNGEIYYNYYCRMCHGVDGEGNGPVGQSYVPKPTDLSSSTVKSLSDGRLYAAMLSGPGHEPVMSQTVLPNHRWPLVLYVRTLGGR